MSDPKPIRVSEYLDDPQRARTTAEERGNLALLLGLSEYTRLCAPRYADPCAAIEMGIPEMFRAARSMLSYAPSTLRRGAIDHAYAEMLAAWHIDPDTLQWVGDPADDSDEAERELAEMEAAAEAEIASRDGAE